MRAAIVFAAAPLTRGPRLTRRLGQVREPYVVAADDGASTALAFGFCPDLVIGDLDSIQPATLAQLAQAGVPIETHPRDKDATDGQLAIERALEVGPSTLWLLGFLGGPRLDQLLANVLLLTRVHTPAVLMDERNECLLLASDAEYTWPAEAGEVVSLLPLSGDVSGVRTHGLRWPLRGETLRLGDTRGVSNEPRSGVRRLGVSIETGLLLVTRHFAA